MKHNILLAAVAVLSSWSVAEEPNKAASKAPSWVEQGNGAGSLEGRRVLRGVGVVQKIRDRSFAAAAADLRACDDVGKLFATLQALVEKEKLAAAAEKGGTEAPVAPTLKLLSKITLKNPRIAARWLDPSDGTLFSLCEVEMADAGVQKAFDEMAADDSGRNASPKPVLSAPDAAWSGPVTAVAASPDGTRALTASLDAIALWDITAGRQLWVKPGGADFLAFSRDGKSAASAAASGLTRAWDVATGRGDAAPGSEIKLAVLSKDYMSSVSSGKSEQEVSRTAKNAVKGSLLGLSTDCSDKDYMHSTTSENMSASKEEQTVSLEGQIAFADPASQARFQRSVKASNKLGGQEAAESVTVNEDWVSPRGDAGLSADEDGKLTVYDPASKQTRRSFSVSGLKSSALSPDGRMILTGSQSAADNLQLWDAQTGASLGSWTLPGPVSAVAFLPDGKKALVGLGSPADNLKVLRIKDKSISSLAAAKP